MLKNNIIFFFILYIFKEGDDHKLNICIKISKTILVASTPGTSGQEMTA